MNKEAGSLSINSENIFPIIKKWLYSDHDIFFRELVSNGCDAITKLKKLSLIGEFEQEADEEYEIKVLVNPDEKTIKFIDNGVGMTADEIKEYINQIAFSGAADFLEKYKDKASEDQIIGHFGLGFYSSFMVAHKVTIDTLSYQTGAEAVHWESEEGTEFEITEGGRTQRGTEITLYLNEDSYEFANEYRAKEVLEKYCSFMPVPIFFRNEAKPEEEKKSEPEGGKEDGKDGEDAVKELPKPINDISPLWTKHPNECTEEEYKEFYRKVFHDYKEPLFWIHLNMDYPFNLKGILYFPKINMEYESIEGTIKLYSNQVFVADNIKEVIPEFLLLLKGVIDCPDLPLNVSRSALQNDGFVKKISDYITKKIADKLTGMYKVERESYEKFWDDISPFIKFGCLRDDKFREKMQDAILYKNLGGSYLTLSEYIEKNDTAEDETADSKPDDGDSKAEAVESENVDESADSGDADDEKPEEKKKITVYYVTDEQQQSQYINMFKEAGTDAVILTHNIDNPFISQVEQHNEKVRFQRIDADLTDTLREETDEEELKEQREELTKLFRDVLGKEKLEVRVEKLKNEKLSSVITLSEESRRMADMMKMYSMPGMNTDMFGEEQTLTLNANNSLVKYVFDHKDGENVRLICEQLYDLAMLAHRPLAPEAMTRFVERSNELMMLLTK